MKTQIVAIVICIIGFFICVVSIISEKSSPKIVVKKSPVQSSSPLPEPVTTDNSNSPDGTAQKASTPIKEEVLEEFENGIKKVGKYDPETGNETIVYRVPTETVQVRTKYIKYTTTIPSPEFSSYEEAKKAHYRSLPPPPAEDGTPKKKKAPIFY